MHLWAHSPNHLGVRHALADHLYGSAELAGEFASGFDAESAARYLTLVHDVGKAGCAWQAGLARVGTGGGRVGGDHKLAGTWLASRHLPKTFSRIVLGHHGGLGSKTNVEEALGEASRTLQTLQEAVDRAAVLVPEILPPSKPTVPAWLTELPRTEQGIALDLLIRMLFSCLVDADFLDTQAHFAASPARVGHPLEVSELLARFEEGRKQLLAERSPSAVDGLRQEVYEQALAAAAGPPGVYRLQVPTGGGKTLAAGAFGLHHAVMHGLRRVVVAVPFISITEQNAAIYRRLLERDGDAVPALLEHHSAVDLDKDSGESNAPVSWSKLAAENWDSPFVVTTMVRLFESLFSHKPSAMRRLHRLAGSVVVLDEVQALPDRLLVPILSGLRGLCDHFGMTVLLASATQPEFVVVSSFAGMRQQPVVADPVPLYDALRRVRYEWRLDPRPSLEEIGREAAGLDQVLVVVNTTKDCAAVHRAMERGRSADAGPVFHLSTRMAPEHRRRTLIEIRELLADGEAVAVVATPLVEAGVDLDFPVVFRALAPAESLQQAAGRCNREGNLVEPGLVVVFHPADGGEPKSESWSQALKATQEKFGLHPLADPDDLAAMEAYYQLRLNRQGDESLGAGIEKLRGELDFPEVAKQFRMIDDEATSPVVVLYSGADDEAERERELDAIREAVADLRSPYPSGPDVLRGLQPYIASLPRGTAWDVRAKGLASPVIGDLLLWEGDYHPQRGIDIENPENVESYSL
ncbi:CRISPR-associated endonuclease Cas3'' [Yinghuangia sp. ASG 101]|nr:CRISPR-associated endonuclease Cas3'' [Yinghuangia sp. ASG 101]UGQ14975.1 CRISPR-associated endonuclease Cas3'' [Yinghuangia sp. ASG 101]